MDKEEILLVAKDTLKEFKYPVERPKMLVLPKYRFVQYLEDMFLKPHPKQTPAFIARLPHGICICFCKEIINSLTKNMEHEEKMLFVEAITMHELYHLKNNFVIKSAKEAIKSEEVVHKKLREDYPYLADIIESVEGQYPQKYIKEKVKSYSDGKYKRYYRKQGR